MSSNSEPEIQLWSFRFGEETVMLQTIEATIDEKGNVRLLEPLQLPEPRRALVTVLPKETGSQRTALLREAALAEDWNRPEEDLAWSHLQQVQPSKAISTT
ncbi:MAG: hypothetical protein OXI80_15030 [Caldilineaceae bacterium]|nr:hypothetical protein [Caldilineaceae bacterium]